MITVLGREIPTYIEGYGQASLYTEAPKADSTVERAAVRVKPAGEGRSKLLATVRDALRTTDLKSGDCISFHHHLRNGDAILNMVLDEAAKIGLRDLTVAASSLFPVHAPLVEHLRSGVVTRIFTAYASGPVADAISNGLLVRPAVMQTHGGRARAIESGDLRIDVAFIAAPSADDYGNLSGTYGPAACGPLGYALADAQYAARVVAITDHLVPYPCCSIAITQDYVDFVVRVESIGDASGILSGTTQATTTATGTEIAKTAAAVIEASGLLRDGFSFQTGAGGISIAVATHLGHAMSRLGVQGSFAAGGITSPIVDMLEMGLFRNLFDVQCFDLDAVASFRRDDRHQAMSASMYANPHNRGAVVNRLDAMILGAAEVDFDFNVNVTTGSSGRILGGSGGHADTAAGSRLAIVTTRLNAGSGPKVVERVRCVTTPGSSIDVVVTEEGIAVNPRNEDLGARLSAAGLNVQPIEALIQKAGRLSAPTRTSSGAGTRNQGRVVAVIEYRDGSVIDVVRQLNA